MKENVKPRVWVEIDHSAIRANFSAVKARVAPLSVMAVLKADAYGLGAEHFARTLLAAGAARIGVAEPCEAFALEKCGATIQILSGVLPEEIPALVANDIVMPVTDEAVARQISNEALRQNKRAKVHFKIDSGMGRAGFLIENARETIPPLYALPGLIPEGIFTHFPIAYRGEDSFTAKQFASFCALVADLARVGCTFPMVHAANSDAINNFSAAVSAPCTMVRTGLNLHGLFDTEGERGLDLRPALALKTRLVAVRKLPAGRTIGYGLSYRLPCDTLVGTVSAGYADGLPLALSNRGSLIIRGRRCPVLGRVSMDYTTVSLEQVPEAVPGDEVICLGRDGEIESSPDDWARLKSTHPYDIICSLGNRVARIHIC